MDDYIKRSDALNAICDDCDRGDDFQKCVNCQRVKRVRDEVPAADVAQVVHSKWICTDYDEAEWLCMNCKESFCLADDMVDPIEDAKLYYCPNCGAKMDGGAK